jgi:hypothetical protein
MPNYPISTVVLTLCLFPIEWTQGQIADEIIKHYFDTVSNGNIENWKKVKSMYTEEVSFYSQEEADQSTPNLLHPPRPSYTKNYKVPPYKSRIEYYSDSTHSQLESTFLWLPDKRVMLFRQIKPVVTRLKDPDPSYSNPVALSKLLDKSESITCKGVKAFPADGMSCYDIEVHTQDQKIIDYYFNTHTYLLEYHKIFNSSDSLNYVRYYNYRDIGNGLLLYMDHYAMRHGRIFNSNSIKKIEVNCPIDPEKFEYDE